MKAFNQGLLSLYAGVQYKLIYNLPVVSGLFFSSQKGTETEAFASWVLAGLLFPLNTIKVRTQLANTEMAGTNILNHSKSSLRQLYRGVVPFLLLNAGVGLTLRGLFNEAKIKHIKE